MLFHLKTCFRYSVVSVVSDRFLEKTLQKNSQLRIKRDILTLMECRGLKEAFEAVVFHIIFLLYIFEFYFRIFKKMSARQDRTSDPV